MLIVDEEGSSIDTFVVGRGATLGRAITTPSADGGPFGFDFDRAGHLLVSDVGLTTGRYAIAPDGDLTALGSTVVGNTPASHPLDEAVSSGQNYLYVLANGLSQIVGYRVGDDGSLTQVTAAPAAAGSGGVAAH